MDKQIVDETYRSS